MVTVPINDANQILSDSSELMEWLATCVDANMWSVCRARRSPESYVTWNIRFYNDEDAAAYKLTFGTEL